MDKQPRVFKELMTLGNEYIVLVDAIKQTLHEVEDVSKQIEDILDSTEYADAYIPKECLTKQLELAMLMADSWSEVQSMILD